MVLLHAGHIGPEPDVNWLSRLRGILLVAVNKWVNKWIIPQSEQDLFNRLLSKLIKYQVEIGLGLIKLVLIRTVYLVCGMIQE